MRRARIAIARLGGLVVVLWVLVTLVFALGNVIPSDPARVYAGEGASPAAIAAKRRELLLDEPIARRYVRYVAGIAHGDLSTSIHTRAPVADDLRRVTAPTLELLLFAAALAGAIGLGAGVATARVSRGATLVRTALLLGASVPGFCLALLLLLVLNAEAHLLPAGGRLSPGVRPPSGPTGLFVIDGLLAGHPAVAGDALEHLLLPGVCLALAPALLIARTLRSSLIHALRQDYSRTARAKGLPGRRVVLRHGLRNSLNAPLSVAGLELGAMLAGIAVIETIFSWPGLGTYLDRSIATDDFPGAAGATLVVGLIYVLANALVDVAQVAADPRLRRSAS